MQVYKYFLRSSMLFLLISCMTGDFEQAISNKGIKLTFDNQYKLISTNEDNQVLIGKSKDGKSLIKIHLIKVKDETEAQLKIKNQLKIKMMSYNFVAVPYPGQMTRSSSCDTSFLPKLQKGPNFNYLFYSASERLSPVVCQGEEVTYHAGSAFYLDQSHKNVLIAEFYIEKQFGIIEINKFFKNNFKNMEIVNIDLL